MDELSECACAFVEVTLVCRIAINNVPPLLVHKGGDEVGGRGLRSEGGVTRRLKQSQGGSNISLKNASLELFLSSSFLFLHSLGLFKSVQTQTVCGGRSIHHPKKTPVFTRKER